MIYPERERREEGLREIFPLSRPVGNGAPAAKSHVLYLLQKGVFPIRIHTYIRTTEKERYRCRHHAHPPLHSTPSISAPPKARFLGTTAERGRSAAAGRREEGGTRDREGDSLHHRSRHIVNNITGQPDQKSELGMECEDNKNFAFQLQQAEKSFRKGWS